MDKERRTYYEYFTDKKWKDISQYHLAFDSSKFEQDKNYTDDKDGIVKSNRVPDSKVLSCRHERLFEPSTSFRK